MNLLVLLSGVLSMLVFCGLIYVLVDVPCDVFGGRAETYVDESARWEARRR